MKTVPIVNFYQENRSEVHPELPDEIILDKNAIVMSSDQEVVVLDSDKLDKEWLKRIFDKLLQSSKVGDTILSESVIPLYRLSLIKVSEFELVDHALNINPFEFIETNDRPGRFNEDITFPVYVQPLLGGTRFQVHKFNSLIKIFDDYGCETEVEFLYNKIANIKESCILSIISKPEGFYIIDCLYYNNTSYITASWKEKYSLLMSLGKTAEVIVPPCRNLASSKDLQSFLQDKKSAIVKQVNGTQSWIYSQLDHEEILENM